MPIPVVPKSSDDPAVAPQASALVPAELALNSGNGILFAKMADGTVMPVRARGLPAGEDGTASGRDRGTFEGGCTDCQIDDNGGVVPPVVEPPLPPSGPPSVATTATSCQQGPGVRRSLTVQWSVSEPSRLASGDTFVIETLYTAQANSGAEYWPTVVVLPAENAAGLSVSADGVAYTYDGVDCGEIPALQQDGSSWWMPQSGPLSAKVYYRNQWRVRVVRGAVAGASSQSQTNSAFPQTCCASYPPDPLGYECVDIGPKSGYRCVNGQCQPVDAGREYAVRPVMRYPDGVSVFATEAAAASHCNSLDLAVPYSTLSACQAACVAGAWKCVLDGTVTTWWCNSSGQCAPSTYPRYVPQFEAGASPGGGGGSIVYYATQAEAAFACTQSVPGYWTQAECQQAGCASQRYKCVTTTSSGQVSHACQPVADADIAASIAAGDKIFSSQSKCQTRCGQATCTGLPEGNCTAFSIYKCYTGSCGYDDGEALSVKEARKRDVLLPAYLSQGWGNAQRTQQDELQFGSLASRTVSYRFECDGTVNGSQSVTVSAPSDMLNGSPSNVTIPRCVSSSNPAP